MDTALTRGLWRASWSGRRSVEPVQAQPTSLPSGERRKLSSPMVRLPRFEKPGAARSRNMAAIKGRDTAPELRVRVALHRAGYRYRLHSRALPGSPDLVLTRYRRVVFVNGCFWHGHGCKRAHESKTNPAYWSAKIERNVKRDARNRRRLGRMGWRVTTIWECDAEAGSRRLIVRLGKASATT